MNGYFQLIGKDGQTYIRLVPPTDGGERLQTGVYLYRVRVACDGSDMVSKAKKLVVIGNN